MIHPYSAIISYDGSDFEGYLTKLRVSGIFKDVFESFPDQATKVVRFILYAYSLESDMLFVDGISWVTLSKKILERVGLGKDVADVDLIIGDENVQKSIQKWLAFQNDENFMQYCMLRDTRSQFLGIAIMPVSAKVTSMDDAAKVKSLVEAKMSAAKYSKELYEMMKDAQTTFVQNHEKLKVSVQALERVVKEKNTAAVEDFII